MGIFFVRSHVVFQLGFPFEIFTAYFATQRHFAHIFSHLMLLHVLVVGAFHPSAIAAKTIVAFFQRIGFDAMTDVVGVLLHSPFPLVDH